MIGDTPPSYNINIIFSELESTFLLTKRTRFTTTYTQKNWASTTCFRGHILIGVCQAWVVIFLSKWRANWSGCAEAVIRRYLQNSSTSAAPVCSIGSELWVRLCFCCLVCSTYTEAWVRRGCDSIVIYLKYWTGVYICFSNRKRCLHILLLFL